MRSHIAGRWTSTTGAVRPFELDPALLAPGETEGRWLAGGRWRESSQPGTEAAIVLTRQGERFEAPPPPRDDELEQRLRALGYVD